MIKIMFVDKNCMVKNVIAESMLTKILKDRQIEQYFEINSSIIMDKNTFKHSVPKDVLDKLKELEIPLEDPETVSLAKIELDEYDYIIGMSNNNIEEVKSILDKKECKKVKLVSFEKKVVEENKADSLCRSIKMSCEELYRSIENRFFKF